MSDIIHDTTINFNANTAAAVANMGNMDKAMMVLSKKSAPAMGGAFKMAAGQAVGMASGFTGASGALGALGQAAFVFNPVMGGVAVALAAVAAVALRKRESLEAANQTLLENRDAIELVAESNLSLADTAKELIKISDKYIQQQLHEVEIKIALAQAGLRETTMWDRLLATLTAGGGVYAAAAAQTAMVNLSTAEQTKLVAELTAKYAEFHKKLGTFDKAKEAADAAKKLADQIARLNDANEAALGREYADMFKERAANEQKLLDIERQRMEIRLRGASETGDLFAIIEASNAIVAAETAAFEQRLNNANAFSGERQVVEAEFTRFLEDQNLKREDALRRSLDREAKAAKEAADAEKKVHEKKTDLILKIGTQHWQDVLLLQHSSLEGIVKATIDAARAELAAKAVVWAAEAVAYAFTPGRQAEATAKATAAAMAGAGAVALSAIATTFETESETLYEQIRRQELESAERDAVRDQVRSDLGFETAGGGTSRSRQSLASTGPVTIFYSQTNTVNGNIYGIEDLFALMDRYNENLFRRLGLDLSQATS